MRYAHFINQILLIVSQWVETDFSYAWARENFLQFRSLQRARDVRDQLSRLCDRVEVQLSSIGSSEIVSIQKALTSGFFYNASRFASCSLNIKTEYLYRLQRSGDSYRTVKNGQTVYIHPSSVLFEQNPKVNQLRL